MNILKYLFIFFKKNKYKKNSFKTTKENCNLEKVKVSYIIDGDTVEVIKDNQIKIIRLYGIDCPEDGQDWGEIAKAGLIKLIGGKYVYLELFGKDIYGRILATIYLKEDLKLININEKMIQKGHAWVVRRFYKNLSKNKQARLNIFERFAKKNKVGLWKNDNPIPPWKWRNKNKA